MAQPWTGYLDPENPPVGSTIIEIDDNGDAILREVQEETPERDEGFDENLATHPALQHALPDISQEIIDGVESDILSRQGWMDNYSRGLDLLGLVIEEASRTKAQKRNISKIRDTTMLESVVKAQSMARGELLPAAGPARIMTVPGISPDEEQLANDFETDLNQALTKGMPEYVPDLDRGLFSFFYGGNMFREGYKCPLKNRPAVATINTEDLIVSEEAVDLDTAIRVTKRIPAMAPSEVKRRQFHGIWRDCDLSGQMPDLDPVQQKKDEIAGKQWQSLRPTDQPYCFYQTITNLDLSMHGFDEKYDVPYGLPVPYRVTVEKYSKQIVHMQRWWNDGDELFNRRRRIIHYEMVPGFGFLAYGFLHLQGNQTQALTAIIRLLVDALMFGNFPGGLKVKGARTETNEIEPGPGEWVEVGLPAQFDDIKKALMAMPYKDVSAVAVQFYELIQQAAARVGSAAMLQTGEGRTNVPVGTVMAMLEEKSIVMAAVHKRLHEGMSRELSMIRELFLEIKGSLAKVIPNPRRQWIEEQEFADLNLQPASDPNVPSQVHRLMLATALATLMSMPVFTAQMDVVEGLKRVLRIIGITNSDALVPGAPPVQPGMDPAAAAASAAAQATAQAKMADVAQKERDSQRKADSQVVQEQQKERDSQRESQDKDKDIASKEKIALIKEATEHARLGMEQQKAQQDAALQHTQMQFDHHQASQDRAMQHEQHQQSMQQQQQNAELDTQEGAQQRSFGGNGL